MSVPSGLRPLGDPIDILVAQARGLADPYVLLPLVLRLVAPSDPQNSDLAFARGERLLFAQDVCAEPPPSPQQLRMVDQHAKDIDHLAVDLVALQVEIGGQLGGICKRDSLFSGNHWSSPKRRRFALNYHARAAMGKTLPVASFPE